MEFFSLYYQEREDIFHRLPLYRVRDYKIKSNVEMQLCHLSLEIKLQKIILYH